MDPRARLDLAVEIAREHMAARQRSTSQSSYHSGRMLARQLGVTIRRAETSREKAIALAIIAAAWLALPQAE
jgi:hypothetical protein